MRLYPVPPLTYFRFPGLPVEPMVAVTETVTETVTLFLQIGSFLQKQIILPKHVKINCNSVADITAYKPLLDSFSKISLQTPG